MNPSNERSIAASKLSQPLKWHSYGGKHYLATKIIELMPPHVHYVEPYAGGLSVLLAKDPEGVSEVVNDLNRDLSNFWSVLRDPGMFAELQRELEATPFDESLFDYSHVYGTSNPFMQGDLVRNAWWFFIRARQSRQGLMKDFATLSRNRVRRGMNEQVSSWLTAIEGLPEVHVRLKRVVVLNRKAVDVIKQQDGEQTLFYCDPPYLHETRVTTSDYQHEMTPEQHSELLDHLADIEGKFILSGYPSRMYDSWAEKKGWRHVDFELPNNASSKSVKERKTERVWMNY